MGKVLAIIIIKCCNVTIIESLKPAQASIARQLDYYNAHAHAGDSVQDAIAIY